MYDWHDYDHPAWIAGYGFDREGWRNRHRRRTRFGYADDELGYRCELGTLFAEEQWRITCKEAKQAWNAVTGLKSPAGETSLPAGSASPLPQELWCLVFRQLAATLEPDGLRGPGLVAADIVRAGFTCRDMYHASREGLQTLAAAVPVDRYRAIPRPLRRRGSTDIDWPFWDRFLREPLRAVRASRLKRALKPLAARASRLKRARKPVALPLPPTKPGLALRLLRALGLKQRCTAPARLWLAVRHERARRFHILGDEWYEEGEPSEAVREALQDLLVVNDKRVERVEWQGSWAAVRKYLAASFGSTEELLAAQQVAREQLRELRRQQAAEADRKSKKKKEEKLERAKRLPALVAAEAQNGLSAERLAKKPILCVCGTMTATKACALKLCDTCCRNYNTGVCHKHKRNAPPPPRPPAQTHTATTTGGRPSGPPPQQAGGAVGKQGQLPAGPGGAGTSHGQPAARPGGAQSGPARATPAGQLHGGLGPASGAALGGLPASGYGRFMVPGNAQSSVSRYGAYGGQLAGGQPYGGQPYGGHGLSSAAGGYSGAGAPHTAPGHGTAGLPYGPMYGVHAAPGYGGYGHGIGPQYGGYGHGIGPQYGGPAPAGMGYGGYGVPGYGGYGLPGYGGYRPPCGPGYGGQGHL